MNWANAVIEHKGILMLAGLFAFLLAGYLWPFAAPAARSGAALPLRRWSRNLGLAVLNGVLSFGVVVPITYFAAAHGLAWRPIVWQGVGGLLFDVLLLDAWLYAWHRLNHRLPALWQFHEIHHLDNALDATSALRFHFGEVLLGSLLRAGLVWLLGMPITSVLLFESLVMVFAMFHHANLRLPQGLERALAWLVVTPSIHWVHHHAVRVDTDSNYATLLSVWDRLFGSQSHTRKFPDMPIGVQGQHDLPFWQLLLRPLRR